MDSKTKNNKKWLALWAVVVVPMVFPLFLFANNLGQAPLVNLWRPLLISVFFSVVVFLIIFIFTRSRDKAVLATVVIVIATFSYGHIYHLIEQEMFFGIMLGRHRYLLPVWGLIVVGLNGLIWFKVKKTADLVKGASILATLLFGFQLVQIIYYETSSLIIQSKEKPSDMSTEMASSNQDQRDVYLIVLDAYTRSDLLKDQLGFDNSDFVAALGDLGFYVVPCSRSNYGYTLQSMTSELNLNYLESLNLSYEDLELSNNLKHSEVRDILENQGYEFVFYETGYPFLEMKDADRFIQASSNHKITDFEALYLETTVFWHAYDLYQNRINKAYDFAVENHVNRVLSTLEGLQSPIEADSPIFVYAHILSPHSPKVFTPDGGVNYEWEADFQKSVEDTYTFVQDQVLIALEAILASSDQEPIIILQSDHGDTFENGFRNLNLNAYYLPDGGEEELYPTITPVNTFRLIFDAYFGMDYPLLPDKVYASPDDSRYDFVEVDDPYENCSILDN